jgi:hypothetical protein
MTICANYANGSMMRPLSHISVPVVGGCKSVHLVCRDVNGRVGFRGADIRRCKFVGLWQVTFASDMYDYSCTSGHTPCHLLDVEICLLGS